MQRKKKEEKKITKNAAFLHVKSTQERRINVVLNKLIFWHVGRRMDRKDLFLTKKVMYDLRR